MTEFKKGMKETTDEIEKSVSDQDIEKAIDMVSHLEEVDDMSQLVQLLA